MSQAVLSQQINTSITECRYCRKNRISQTFCQTELRNKSNCITHCTDSFCSKHTDQNFLHQPDHSAHSVHIIGLLDNTPVPQRYFLSQTYKNNTAQGNQSHTSDLDQDKNNNLTCQSPVSCRNNCHKPCYTYTCGCGKHGICKRCVVSGCRTKRQPQK